MTTALLQRALDDLVIAPKFVLETTRTAHIDKTYRNLSARRQLTIAALQAAIAQPEQPSSTQGYAAKIEALIQERDAAIAAASAVPPGYRLVPIELEAAMREVMIDRLGKVGRGACLLFTDIWSDLLAAAPQPPSTAMQPMTCVWTEQDDDDMPGTYASACGEMWSLNDGSITENNVRFCHGCGKPVEVTKAAP